jgi:hypothetical protein
MQMSDVTLPATDPTADAEPAIVHELRAAAMHYVVFLDHERRKDLLAYIDKQKPATARGEEPKATAHSDEDWKTAEELHDLAFTTERTKSISNIATALTVRRASPEPAKEPGERSFPDLTEALGIIDNHEATIRKVCAELADARSAVELAEQREKEARRTAEDWRNEANDNMAAVERVRREREGFRRNRNEFSRELSSVKAELAEAKREIAEEKASRDKPIRQLEELRVRMRHERCETWAIVVDSALESLRPAHPPTELLSAAKEFEPSEPQPAKPPEPETDGGCGVWSCCECGHPLHVGCCGVVEHKTTCLCQGTESSAVRSAREGIEQLEKLTDAVESSRLAEVDDGELCGCGKPATRMDPHNDGDRPLEFCDECYVKETKRLEEQKPSVAESAAVQPVERMTREEIAKLRRQCEGHHDEQTCLGHRGPVFTLSTRRTLLLLAAAERDLNQYDALARYHKILDDLALYVFRYGKDPSESFRAVELLQEMAERYGFWLTATFSREHWEEQKAGLAAGKEAK